MKKVVIAIDSFKGCLPSAEAGKAAAEGIRSVFPKCEILSLPIADGGEGMLDVLIAATNGREVQISAHNPLMEWHDTYYGISEDGKTAFIEMASISGLPLVPPEKRNPMLTTSYGTGELIRDALERGCRNFIIGIGGSATNDAGLGMLQALGFRFLDKEGKILETGNGKILMEVASIDTSFVHPDLRTSHFTVACDVQNPFYGLEGAAYIFAPQKGADRKMVEALDAGMKNYAEVTAKVIGKDNQNAAGAGAAGGLGFAFLNYLDGELTPGIQLILDAVHIEDEMKDADVVVTGEGRLDHQTAMGKAPVGVAKLGRKYGAKTIAFAGSVTKEAVACNEAGIDAFFPIVRGISTLEEAMDPDTAKANMAATAEQVFRLL